MPSLKSVLKMPRLVRRRVVNSVKIRKFDKRSDDYGRFAESGLPEGYLKTTIDKILDAPGLTDRMIASELHVRPDEKARAYYSWDVPAFLWQAILNSKSLAHIVQSYIGPRARLDDLYVKSVMDGLNSVSEGWHDDNVGYRLKVFMVFDVEGQPSGTVVIPTPRPHLYNVRVADELSRFLFKPKTEERGGGMKVSYERGDCLVFDTNIPHRGDYSSGEGVRYCVIAEFIDREKADAITGRAPCGPGQGQKQLRIPKLDGVAVKGHPLIDANLLRPAEDSFLYGYPKVSA